MERHKQNLNFYALFYSSTSSRPCTGDVFFTAVFSFCLLASESLRNSRNKTRKAAPVKHAVAPFITLEDNVCSQQKTWGFFL